MGLSPLAQRRVSAAVVQEPVSESPSIVSGGIPRETEAPPDALGHESADHLAGDAAGGGDIAHGLAIAAIAREGDPRASTIVAADLDAVGPPAGVRAITSDTPIMTAFRALPGMRLE